MTQEEIQQIMDNLDYDKNSKINYNEFLAASINVQEHMSKKKLDSLFS